MKKKILIPVLVASVALTLFGGAAVASNNGLLFNSTVETTVATPEEENATEREPLAEGKVTPSATAEPNIAADNPVGEPVSTEKTTSETDTSSNNPRVPSSTDKPLTAQPAPIKPAPSSPDDPPASPSPIVIIKPSPTPTTPPPPPPAPAPPACPSNVGGSVPGFTTKTSPLGVAGTTYDDLQSFATKYNQIRVANCLPPVPMNNFRYDSCMEQRLFWMAEDPSTDPMSAWGHIGSQRSDGVPSVGCDGNLAGGSGNTGATVAQKWWDSSGHRSSLYKPTYTGSTGGVCILFAMTHGGVPNEPYAFTRAAARWVNC